MDDWISVRDRLPEPYDTVLIIVSGKPEKNVTLIEAYEFGAYSDVDGWIVAAYPEWENAIVTHWMELPEPPPREEATP